MRFKGLQEIFTVGSDSLQTLKEPWVSSKPLPHPVKTALTSRAEQCRQLMLCVAEADRTFIRSCIEQQEPYALQLYRGQTRFILEHLADVPAFKSLTMKQRKKTAALVAQEMISRNQAHSNLVEILLPNYVRLSIHAHNNKGPLLIPSSASTLCLRNSWRRANGLSLSLYTHSMHSQTSCEMCGVFSRLVLNGGFQIIPFF